MSTNRKLPLSEKELEAFEATRDLAAELIQAGKEMKAGLGTVVYSPLIAARKNAGLSYEQFAALLGISVQTLKAWEQDRKPLKKAASAIVSIALNNPEVLKARLLASES